MTIHRSAVRTAASAALLATALGFAAAPAIAADLRGWNIHPEDYPVSAGMDFFTEEMEKRTEGRVTGKTFHGGVLGSQPDAIEQVRIGALDFAEFSLGPLGPIVPAANVVSLPFIFKSLPQMYELMDGEVGETIGAAMEEKGLVALGWYDAGARSFYNSTRPITQPADLEGLKVRVMNNDLFVGMVEALGGNASPMAYAEVLQSLKTGVIDGAENNPPSFESSSHYEAAKYYSLTEHLIIPEVLVMSKKAFDALSPEDQQIAREVGAESADLQRGQWQDRQEASMELVKEAGVEVNTIDDKGPFQDAMAGVYDGFLAANPDQAELVDMIRNAD